MPNKRINITVDETNWEKFGIIVKEKDKRTRTQQIALWIENYIKENETKKL